MRIYSPWLYFFFSHADTGDWAQSKKVDIGGMGMESWNPLEIGLSDSNLYLLEADLGAESHSK